jgi:hypothetical protein
MSGGGPNYVVHGAEIKCSFGLRTSNVVVPLSHGVFIHSIAQLTIYDYKPMVNILPFGGCTSPENPSVQAAAAAMSVAMQAKPKGFIEKVISFFCKPKDNAQDDSFVSQCAGVCTPIIVTPWQNGKDIVEIDGKPALLASSCVSCLYKGEITFTTDGQSESTETIFMEAPQAELM